MYVKNKNVLKAYINNRLISYNNGYERIYPLITLEMKTSHFRLQVIEDNTIISIYKQNDEYIKVDYSTDNKQTWTALTGLGQNFDRLKFNAGDVIYIRGKIISQLSKPASPSELPPDSYMNITIDQGKVNPKGNIMYLYNYENPLTDTINYKHAFDYLFEPVPINNYHPENGINDVSELELPATTLSEGCYSHMFCGCEAITTSPKLPATTLVKDCYFAMFSGCKSLNKVILKASDISATNCTYHWLNGVAATGEVYNAGNASFTEDSVNGIPTGWEEHSLRKSFVIHHNLQNEGGNNGTVSVNIASLPSQQTMAYTKDLYDGYFTSLNLNDLVKLRKNEKMFVKGNLRRDNYSSIYTNMVITSSDDNVKASITGSINKVIGDTMRNYACKNFFKNSTALTNSPTLPARTLAIGCYSNMFEGCTSLIELPVLPAGTGCSSNELADNCYASMFKGCTSLTTIPSDTVFKSCILTNGCYANMFENCISLTTVNGLNVHFKTADNCFNGTFKGCINLTTVSDFDSYITTAKRCYYEMFSGCTSLVNMPLIDLSSLSPYCCAYMFDGCTSLVIPSGRSLTGNSIMVAADYCYAGMFRNCSNIEYAPKLMNNTLATRCYYRMFDGCSKLSFIISYATDISASYCTYQWVRGVAKCGTFIKDYSMSSWTTGDNGIPANWTVQGA